MLTWHNDSARTGQTLHEEILTHAAVITNHFGKLWVLPADGKVEAQPLYAAGVSIPGKGVRNVVFFATEHDSVYAYDADSTNLFWQWSMLGTNEAPSDARNCDQVTPEIGVTATPVIDRQLGPSGTMFVVAMSKRSTSTYFQRLHALDLATGTNRIPAATIAATFPGAGANSSGSNVVFDPGQYKERPGLLLLNGVVYTAWSSHCDFDPYTGWIMGYDERTLAQTNVLNVTPNGNEGAIWMSGAGLAADSLGNIYFLDANGTFDATLTNGFPSQGDFGNAFIKLSTTSNRLAVVDYFAGYTNALENATDEDLGSGGALVLPDLTDLLGNTRQLVVGAGKDQNIYLLDRTNMGKFSAVNNNAIYQELYNAMPGGVWSSPAYFNSTLYYASDSQQLQAFPLQNALLLPSSSQTTATLGYPPPTPSVSANGTNNAIVWAGENATPAVLHAYAATNLAIELYNSNQAATNRDHFGAGSKFVVPTVAAGRVYLGAAAGVAVFGLLDTSTLTPLQLWRKSHFGNPSSVGQGADGASPAGDGVPNLLKYALGLDPFTPVIRSKLTTGSIAQLSGQSYATLSIPRTNRATDITYAVQISTDLQNWASGSGNTVTVTDTTSQLVVRDATPLGTAPRFMRLTVSNP
ncbi:MAG TPA: pyrrolo-quinoline quinone [Candidatus Binatia bacterium]|nr:pyrrolo-quinoline quinone [Candidatus Binatia bacterium]